VLFLRKQHHSNRLQGYPDHEEIHELLLKNTPKKKDGYLFRASAKTLFSGQAGKDYGSDTIHRQIIFPPSLKLETERPYFVTILNQYVKHERNKNR
jgi:hypothetical protein